MAFTQILHNALIYSAYLRITNHSNDTSINNKGCNNKDKPVINKIKLRQGYGPVKVA